MEQPSRQRHDEATTSSASRVWLPEIVQRIATFLPRNEVACTLRLLDKATAAQFNRPEFNTVRLSEPVPHDAFKRRWGASGVMRGLTFNQRLQLLCLTARSGSIDNLALVVTATEFVLSATPFTQVFAAAASAGHLHVCKWLRQQGFPMWPSVLRAIARAGHQHICDWLLDQGCAWDKYAVVAAARGGHMALAEWLQQRRPPTFDAVNGGFLSAAVAEGCDLATLQRHYAELGNRFDAYEMQYVVAAAAASPTPDWQAKVAWLESKGCPRSSDVCWGAASCSDAADRLAWLQGRGYPVYTEVVIAAISAGNTAALEYLLRQNRGIDTKHLNVQVAAESGNLDMLRVLQAAGCSLERRPVLQGAVRGGHLHVVAWLVETLGIDLRRRSELMASAARSGNLQLLVWLHERGCPRGSATLSDAALGGCEEATEWMVQQGWRLSDGGSNNRSIARVYDPYMMSGRQGDMAILRCLRRLGVPWYHGAGANTFQNCIFGDCPVPVLAWLLEEGCPVDWEAARRAANDSRQEPLVEWLTQQQQQQREQVGAAGAGVLPVPAPGEL